MIYICVRTYGNGYYQNKICAMHKLNAKSSTMQTEIGFPMNGFRFQFTEKI